MLSRLRYRNSICKRGSYLHKFKNIVQTQTGILERCERCGLTKHFPNNSPNVYFLSYHIRSILRADDKLYYREYPKQNAR